jgi:hypothetical protein
MESRMIQVIARFQDGRVLKGHTQDFSPTQERFHLLPAGSPPGTRPLEVRIPDLKGVFFVKRLEGNPAHMKRNVFEPASRAPGHRIRVVFKDGEVLHGLAQAYHPDDEGFFLLPADPRSNNEKCFVVRSATREVTLL